MRIARGTTARVALLSPEDPQPGPIRSARARQDDPVMNRLLVGILVNLLAERLRQYAWCAGGGAKFVVTTVSKFHPIL
jgi:hypothetical protein